MKPETFEKFTRAKGLTPQDYKTLPEGVIYLADGFKTDNPREFPFGYFETAWALARDKMQIAQVLTFDAFHDPGYDPQKKKQMRLGAATREAVKHMGHEVMAGQRHA